ncbi:MAG: ABC transporter permease [Spirochaetales bacterium]|nr:ABC transporter permease [Spirochaetales bacterium]
MKSFITLFKIQLKLEIREKGILLNYYVVPLLFYLVVGAVFAGINPEMKSHLAAIMIIFGITMGGILGIPIPIVTMKEQGVFRAFSVNGISKGIAILAHTLSAFIHILIVSLVIYFTSPIIFKSDIPENIFAFFIVLLLLIFTSASIGTLIGLVAKGQSSSIMLSQIIFLPSLLLSGIMFPSSMLPSLLIKISQILPATQAMKAFLGLAYNHQAVSNGVSSMIILFLIGIFAFFANIILLNQNKTL